MIIELHILQNFAPSNLNRDDTNSPKECEFGGYRRARISSQCIKRSIRKYFKDNALLPPEALAKRTKLLVDNLTDRLVNKGKEKEQAQNVVTKAVSSMGLALKENQTQYLVFLGEMEFTKLADLILNHWAELAETKDDKGKKEKETTSLGKELLKVLDGGKAADLALFGRMLADLPDKSRDAACQVAHAISTHKVGVEFDFYTAMDDLQPKEETGAGMMGTVEFNSACYYRYANIDVNQLKDNLLGKPREKATADELKEARALAGKTVDAFIRAAVNAIPTGKQNSFAAQNPPSFIFAVGRDSGTWSLANAFASPVWVGDNGDLVQKSQDALIDYWDKLVKVYGEKGIKAKPAVTLNASQLSGLDSVENLDMLIARINQTVEVDS